MCMPIFSIIVPTYNCEKFIGKCIESIRNQTCRDWELMLIDDGSTDETGAICAEYANLDTRIKYFHQQNAGPGAARNRGLDHACGEYVVFVDSDDWVDSTFLSDYLVYAKDYEIVYWGGYYKEYDDGRSVKVNDLELCTTDIPAAIQYLWKHDRFGWTWMKCFRRDIIEQHHIRFAETVYFREDAIFTAEYFKYVNRVKVLSVANYHYRIVETSLVHTRWNNPREMLYVDDRIYNALSIYFHDKTFREFTDHWYLVNLHNVIKKSFVRKNKDKFSDTERKQLIEKCVAHRQQSHFANYLYSQNKILHTLLKTLWATENKMFIYYGLKNLMRYFRR